MGNNNTSFGQRLQVADKTKVKKITLTGNETPDAVDIKEFIACTIASKDAFEFSGEENGDAFLPQTSLEIGCATQETIWIKGVADQEVFIIGGVVK